MISSDAKFKLVLSHPDWHIVRLRASETFSNWILVDLVVWDAELALNWDEKWKLEVVLSLYYCETGLLFLYIENIFIFVVERDLERGVFSVAGEEVFIFSYLFCVKYVLTLVLLHS